MTVLEEVFVPLPEPAIDPVAPDPALRAAHKERPGWIVNNDYVPMFRAELLDR